VSLRWGVKYGLILLVFFHPIFIPYPHSTPSGLGPSSAVAQVFLRLLSRYASYCVSNSTPIGVDTSDVKPTGSTCGYSNSTPIGVDTSDVKPTGSTCGYSHSTPIGVDTSDAKPTERCSLKVKSGPGCRIDRYKFFSFKLILLKMGTLRR
jgi:hypothetical protein